MPKHGSLPEGKNIMPHPECQFGTKCEGPVGVRIRCDTIPGEGLVESAGVGEASFYAMIDRATNEPGFYKEQMNLLTGDSELAMKELVRIALADGAISPDELKMLRHFSLQYAKLHPRRTDLRNALVPVRNEAEWRAVIDAFYA